MQKWLNVWIKVTYKQDYIVLGKIPNTESVKQLQNMG